MNLRTPRRRLLAIPAALCLTFGAAAEPVLPEDPAWLGCWRSTNGAQTIWFESTRCGWLRDGTPSFYRVDHGSDRALLESWAQFTELQLRIGGERLSVTGPDGALQFERMSQVPRVLRMEPYELPEEVDVDPETVANLLEELRERRQEDQRVRKDLATGGTTADPSNMLRVDTENTEFLRTLIDELGWIDATRFGSEASDAAFLLVQHSGDVRLMRTALPRIEADVKAGRLDGQAFALLHDRCQLSLGYLQRYGSQIGRLADGTSVWMPCENPEGVDAQRQAMGMGPLADYLAYFTSDDGTPVQPLRSQTDLRAQKSR
ncbi:MAG: hypothetical protein ACI8QZ_001880 [Chlamydiales bacterium]|jgi:hypothetical protein